MRSISKRSGKEKFWRDQVRLFASFNGSQTAFCRHHGLSVSTFQYWHRKFHQTDREVQIVDPSPFIEVQVESAPSRPKMPDAKWVAELILHLQEGMR